MTQIAQLRENVKMINRNTTLLTDSLNYDRLYDLGYYFEGGTLMDEENVDRKSTRLNSSHSH